MVGHFHFFFVVFLFSAIAVAFLLSINARQTPGTPTTMLFSKLAVFVAFVFFTGTVASGLFGG